MSALIQNPHRAGRRLAGAMLSAVITTAMAMPVAVWAAGLILGPPALRQKIIITTSSLSAFHGRAAILAVMAATFVLLTASNLMFGQRPRYAQGAMLPALLDDALSARDKLTVLLTSGWGWAAIVLNAFWIALALPIGR